MPRGQSSALEDFAQEALRLSGLWGRDATMSVVVCAQGEDMEQASKCSVVKTEQRTDGGTGRHGAGPGVVLVAGWLGQGALPRSGPESDVAPAPTRLPTATVSAGTL